MKNFTISIYWGARKESVQDISKKLLSTFQDLIKVDNIFENFYETIYDANTQTYKGIKVKIAEDFFLQTLERQEVNKVKDIILGYRRSYQDKSIGEESFRLSFLIGNEDNLSPNCFVLRYPQKNRIILKKYFSKDFLINILNILVENWQPEYGKVESTMLKNLILENLDYNKMPPDYLSFINYAQHSFTKLRTYESIKIQNMGKGYILFFDDPYATINSQAIGKYVELNKYWYK